jgi:hypothetical protein
VEQGGGARTEEGGAGERTPEERGGAAARRRAGSSGEAGRRGHRRARGRRAGERGRPARHGGAGSKYGDRHWPTQNIGGRRQDLWRRPPDTCSAGARGVGAKIYGAASLTRHGQLCFHVRQTYANNIGAGTHNLGVNDDGAERRVHFLKRNCEGHNCAKKPENGQFGKKLVYSPSSTQMKVEHGGITLCL